MDCKYIFCADARGIVKKKKKSNDFFFFLAELEIYTHGNSSSYIVRSNKDLNSVIIPHFLKYPLQTQKQVDFWLFKAIVDKINKDNHLTEEGLQEIGGIRRY